MGINSWFCFPFWQSPQLSVSSTDDEIEEAEDRKDAVNDSIQSIPSTVWDPKEAVNGSIQSIPPAAWFLPEISRTQSLAQPWPGDITDALYGTRQSQVLPFSYFFDLYHAVYDNGKADSAPIRVILKRCWTLDDLEPATDARDQRVLDDLRRNIVQWMGLSHPNVLPFLGTTTIRDSLCFVVPRMMHGNLGQFLLSHPDADKASLVRGIARGLEYLHTRNPSIHHGQLTSPNVLIDDSFEPLLTDFCLGEVKVERHPRTTNIHAMPLAPPEYMDPSPIWDPASLFPADVWCFGILTYEILNGKAPFHEMKSNFKASLAIRKGALPTIPEGWADFYDGLREIPLVEMMQACWSFDPKQRPSMEVVVQTYLKPQKSELW